MSFRIEIELSDKTGSEQLLVAASKREQFSNIAKTKMATNIVLYMTDISPPCRAVLSVAHILGIDIEKR